MARVNARHRTAERRAHCRTRLLLSCVLLANMSLVSGCRLEGRSRRAERLLGELEPALRLGETLIEARAARPNIGVRHPGDSPNLYIASDSEPPRAVAVVVWPRPALGEQVAGTAVVEAVELVMSPRVAERVLHRVTELFGAPVHSVCAGQSLEQTDRMATWELGRRGGVLLAFPERRPDGVVPTSRLFIYTSEWHPERVLSGYGMAPCSLQE